MTPRPLTEREQNLIDLYGYCSLGWSFSLLERCPRTYANLTPTGARGKLYNRF